MVATSTAYEYVSKAGAKCKCAGRSLRSCSTGHTVKSRHVTKREAQNVISSSNKLDFRLSAARFGSTAVVREPSSISNSRRCTGFREPLSDDVDVDGLRLYKLVNFSPIERKMPFTFCIAEGELPGLERSVLVRGATGSGTYALSTLKAYEQNDI